MDGGFDLILLTPENQMMGQQSSQPSEFTLPIHPFQFAYYLIPSLVTIETMCQELIVLAPPLLARYARVMNFRLVVSVDRYGKPCISDLLPVGKRSLLELAIIQQHKDIRLRDALQ